MNEMISAYNKAIDSPIFREYERLREDALHEEAWKLGNAERKGMEKSRAEIAKMLLEMGDSIEKIMKATGLTREEIERLHSTN